MGVQCVQIARVGSFPDLGKKIFFGHQGVLPFDQVFQDLNSLGG